MAIIKAFKGLRPKSEFAKDVSALPYDVMNSAEAREMAKGNAHSFLHVSRAEIDLPEELDVHSKEVYQKAKSNFEKLMTDQVLIQENTNCLYVYAQTMEGRKQIGLVACSSIEDYFQDVIKKHEFTRPEKEQDRIAHMLALQAHVGPIFLTYPKNDTLKSLLNGVVLTEAAYDFISSDNIRHQFWVINNEEKINDIISVFEKEIPFTYIADGHHRTASAAKVGQQLRSQNPHHTGTEEYNFFLSVLFADDELAIMDYNRLVKDLNGLNSETFLERVKEKFSISKVEFKDSKPGKLHDFAMYLDGIWYKLTAKETSYSSDPIGILDVTILQENILKPILAIQDPRTDKRIDFVGGIRGLDELKKRVDSGEMAVAFALFPVSLQQLMDIADSGNVMPPKSTWFEPKLRDGLITHLF